MPEREKLVNLGGVIEGFPTVSQPSPSQFSPFDPSGDIAAPPSVNDHFNALGSGTPQGRASIPINSFYTGARFNSALPGTDTNEMAAQQQSAWDKWGNAVVKMAGTAGTTFVSGTAGLVYGIGASASEGRFSALFDNDVTRSMDDISKKLEDVLPNYYTHQEQDANWYSPDNLLTANFWADKVLKNLGFSAGAMAGGLVWGSLFRAVGLTNGLVQAGKTLELIEATEQVMTTVPRVQQFGAMQSALSSLGKQYLKPAGAVILKNSDRILTSAMGTFGEASMEALHNLNDFRTKLIDDYKGKYGFAPTGEELKEINEYADKVGNYTWGLNTMLLTATNFIMLPKILGSSRTADKALLNDIIKTGEGKFASASQKWYNKVDGGFGLLFSKAEAFEEGAQFAIQTGTEEYFNRAFKNREDVNDFFSNMANVMGTVSEEGVHKTFSTKEGIENMIIGGISGSLQQARGVIKEQGILGGGGVRKKNTDLAVAALNKTDIKAFLESGAKYIARGINSQKLRQEAILANDVLSEKDYELDYALSYILPRIKYGKLDSLTAEIDAYTQQAKSDEGFQELKNAGIVSQNETKEQFLVRADSIKEIAINSSKLYSQIKDKYSNFVDKKGNRIYNDDVIDRMVYSAAKVEDYNQRILEVSSTLLESGIDGGAIGEDILSGKVESFQAAAGEIDKLKVNSDVKENLLTQLKDVTELILRRERYIQEYDAIKKAPEKVKESDFTPKVENAGETIAVKTKDGEEEIVIGEEYFLGKVVEYDKDGKEVHRFPKLTILGENEDDTIKIKDGSGEVRDVSKAVLEDYKLGKVSDTKNNKKAKFYMDNANTIFEIKLKPRKGKKKQANPRGRLEFNPKGGVLTFVYKENGKIKRIEVTGDQFVAKKGYKEARITPVGEVTAEYATAAEAFAAAKDERTAGKMADRMKILNDLFDEMSESHTKTQKLIETKKKELETITEELADLRNKIENAPLTPKRGNFKAATKKAIQASRKLMTLQDQLTDELQVLESELTELEINADYVADLIQNMDEMPTEGKDFLEELQEQSTVLQDLIAETGIEINAISKLIDNVQAALDSAIKYVQSVVDNFSSMYEKVPLAFGEDWVEFLQENPNFLKNRPYFRSDLKVVEGIVAQVEDLDITPNERTLSELRENLVELQGSLAEVEKELKAKTVILNRFKTIAEKHKLQKEEETKLANDDNLRRGLLASADPGVQTKKADPNYEPDKRKSNIKIPTSSKVPPKSTLPHHVRSNKFGMDFNNLPNRENIRGVFVTSKNEAELGLEGLTQFLKGDSDVDADTIIVLVMVQDGKPVGVNGEVLESPSMENAIFQVMPDPKLEWSEEYGGGTMFRKGTTPEQIEYYKKQYAEFVKETLENPSLKEHTIEPSFGIPDYVKTTNDKGEQVRDYKAKTSVVDAGLVEKSTLTESQVIKVATESEFLEKGSTSFQTPLGRVFLDLPNGYVPLQNRQLTSKEAQAIHGAILALSEEAFRDGNVKSEKSLRLIKWLKSVVYWGNPQNATGYNSVFFTTAKDGKLVMSGNGAEFDFTPSAIAANKGKIIALLEGMYNNVNATMVGNDTLWSEPYEEIVEITPSGEIKTKMWDNYQTYLLTSPGLPLSTQIKPIEEGEVNRHGIYFTVTDNVDRYSSPPEAKAPTKLTPKLAKGEPAKAAPAKESAPKGNAPLPIGRKYVLDGKTLNVFTTKTGKHIPFVSSGPANISILRQGDTNAILADLTEQIGEDRAKASIKTSIANSVAEHMAKNQEEGESFSLSDFDEAAETTHVETKPEVQAKETAPEVLGEEPSLTEEPTRKPATIEITKADEEEMSFQLSDFEEDTPLRVKLRENSQKFVSENWAKTEEWLKANFPNLPIYRVKRVIQATNGAQAWGMLKDGAIYVYENAEVGTIYHEVFEGVWKMFTTTEEQDAVRAEFRGRKGSFVDRPTGRTVEYSKATDEEVKEQLAEEFRDYVLNQKPKPKSLIGKIFADIVNFIKAFFTGNKAVSNTDKLFDKIGTGYYKTFIPQESALSFAKEGFIDIEEAFASAHSEFRIAKIPAHDVNSIMQHMTYITLSDLFRSKQSLFNVSKINQKALYEKLKLDLQRTALKSRFEAEQDVKAKKMTQAQAAPIIAESKALWKNITTEWDSLVQKHKEYLRIYSIEFDENDELAFAEEDKTKDSGYGDANKIDYFRKANSAIKLLLGNMPRITSDNKFVHSSINGVQLVPMSEVYMAIMNRVHTSRNIDEMLDRLKVMSEEDPNYKTIYKILTKNNADLSQVTQVHDAQLITAFWRTFKKQNPDVKNVYLFENGDVEVGDSNLSSAARQISSEYANAIVKTVKGTNPYFEYSVEKRAFVGKPASVKNIALSSPEKRIAFLKTLGIEFELSEILALDAGKLETFNRATAGIKRSIEKAEEIVTPSRKVLDISGDLLQLGLVRAGINNPEFDSTFFNIQGERTQSFIGTNPASDLFEVLSQVKNKRDLINTPFAYLLTDVFAKGNSVILNKIFNPETGNRIQGGEKLMKPGYADGTINTENGKKKSSSKLTYKERLVQELNLNLSGYYYNLVPGDSSMEWMAYMGNAVTADSLLSGDAQINAIFKGYFKDEWELAKDKRPVVKKRDNKDLRFFKGILGDALHSKVIKTKGTAEEVYLAHEAEINKAVKVFIEKETAKLQETLTNYSIIEKTEDGLVVNNLAFAKNETITDAVLFRNLKALSVNYMVSNIELHKLLYSDPYQYSDELKRVKNASSPRLAIIHSSPAFNASLTRLWNEGFSKDDIGYTDMTKDYFTTVVHADVVSSSELKDYGMFEETDGGGIITMKAYRWLRVKAGDWSEDEERQYRFDIAYEKRDKNLDISSEEQKLLASEDQLIKDGLLEIRSAYVPQKPIVFGSKGNEKNYNDIVLDKFALYPLSYRIIKELNPTSNAVKLYNKMQKEGIDYTVFASGRKVGNEGSNNLYTPKGEFNQTPYTNIVKVPHSIIAIQSEVPSKDEPVVTRGTQITKLATLDYMEAGVPIDFEPGDDFKARFDAWNKLLPSEKYSYPTKDNTPNLYTEIQKNKELLEELTKDAYELLLTKMGIKYIPSKGKIPGKFILEDFNKVAEMLEKEILKREVNDNIMDAFAAFRNQKVVLEATPAYRQIRNVLYSIANKNVILPKISGGQKVQISSTALESVRVEGVEYKDKDGNTKYRYESKELGFYTDEDGKRVCEVMVGRWFGSNMSDAELLKYLNTTEEGQKLIHGVAFRVPTQKQNSIDVFRIKQFLPNEFGDSVVIPSALVKKVGSDFDIDKLFMYFKNVILDEKGKPSLVKNKGSKEETVEFYSKMFDKIVESEEQYILRQLNKLSKNEEYDREAEQKWIEKQEKLNKRVINKQDFLDTIYKKALENDYIQSTQNLISHPLNFANLTKPNSADPLKDLAKDITNKLGKASLDADNVTNMLDRGFMSNLRHAFVSGKYAIGIAAVNQTNHSLNQRQPIYIDPGKWSLLSAQDRYFLSGGTRNADDATLKFKNFNRLEVDNRIVTTLSMVKNAEGENISDIIGMFIDGYVDISKGPWIMELGATPDTAATWLFLVKSGVPIKDVAYFMNQPIIKEYLKSIETSGYSYLFITDLIDSAREKYMTPNIRKVSEVPAVDALGKMIGKTPAQLSDKQKDEQQLILTEFLKAAKMANHLFLVTQGSNFDTANLNDPYLIFKKFKQLEKAQSSIISNVDDLIENSFLGELGQAVYDLRDAFATILTSDTNNVRKVIQTVLEPHIDLPDAEFVKLAQKAVYDLFDWAVQIDRKLNTQVEDILLSDNNTAKQVSDFVISVKKNDRHPLYNNAVINLITPHFQRKGKVNNLKIKNASNKVYDQNQMIYAFSELRTYLKGPKSPNKTLYGSLVRLAVLQSGLANSPISFTSLLPFEDFQKIYNQTLSKLENIPNLQSFADLHVFERNNWNNSDLVPLRKAKKSRGGLGKYNSNMNFGYTAGIQKAINAKEIPQLLKLNENAREAKNDIIVYTWQTAFGDKAKEMRKKGDYSYIKKGLFERVYRGDVPLTQSYIITDEKTGKPVVITDYIYKAINAWGESHGSDGIYFSANEFYAGGIKSVIDNGFIKVEREAMDATILTYFNQSKPTPQPLKGEDQVPECI